MAADTVEAVATVSAAFAVLSWLEMLTTVLPLLP